VLNGLWGDRFERDGSALDLSLTLRHGGTDLPATGSALARAHPDATSHLVVFVHGLMESDESWWQASTSIPDDLPTHGHRLRRDLGSTPVWLRYNSGRRVSAVGRDLDRLMATLEATWPVPVRSISLVGHSMGGLVARSAVAVASARRAAWVELVEHVVCLGSPHHGAPLEKLTNTAAWALRVAPESRPFAAFLNRRSVGIKDLRFGNVHDDDWRDQDPDALLDDTRTDPVFVEGVDYHAVAGRLGSGVLGHLLGDGLVRLSSATGHHRRRTLPFRRTVALESMHHLAMLHHLAVYEQVREALSPSAPDR
jgi:pimeloyl-ACP methyl ester carboxylesterase